MIFVTVGTHNVGFDRLIRKMDEIAKDLHEDVIMQIGSSKYIPNNTKYFDFVDQETMIDYISTARVVITHAGAGTILTIIRYGKTMILVPRSETCGECCDNQQFDISKLLEDRGEAIAVYDLENLQMAIARADSFHPSEKKKDITLVQFLQLTIKEMAP